MKIICTGIVHYPDKVILVKPKKDKNLWKLPERILDETEDVLLCMRRCVLSQTGYRVAKLRLYKIQTQARTPKKAPYIRFIFGCEVGDHQLQTPSMESGHFTPEEVLKLSAKEEFDNPTLLKLIHNYFGTLTVPDDHNPMPVY